MARRFPRKLLKIQDDDLLVEQNNMEKKIKVTELLIHEKEKRLEDTPSLARELFLGIEYWNLKNETEAGNISVTLTTRSERIYRNSPEPPNGRSERKGRNRRFMPFFGKTDYLPREQTTGKSEIFWLYARQKNKTTEN